MITFLYAGLLSLLFLFLSVRVIKLRRAKKVVLMDGGDKEMMGTIRAHGNFAEYVPLALILMFLSESNDGNPLVVHLIGLLLVVGRVMHAYGILVLEAHTREKRDFRGRIYGMFLTFGAIAIGAINLLMRFTLGF